MKAKTRQLHIANALDHQDHEISQLTSKAKRELCEYNEQSKTYISSFVSAFTNAGDMDKLPHHPFMPPLDELEHAIARRKATLIEKVQQDDRVRWLERQKSEERVTRNVIEKNERE